MDSSLAGKSVEFLWKMFDFNINFQGEGQFYAIFLFYNFFIFSKFLALQLFNLWHTYVFSHLNRV